MNPSTSPRPVRLLAWAATLIVIYCAYILVVAFHVAQTTGTLEISSTKGGAALSISQTDGAAQIIGHSKAKIHLAPGVYHLAAVTDGKEAVATARITKQRLTVVRLDFSQSVVLRSYLDVDFRNTTALIDRGLTTTQLHSIEQSFFRFRPNAKVVVINQASIRSVPHNILTDGATFRLSFSSTIDNTTYSAIVAYSGLDTASLLLYDQTGSLVFNSNS